MSGVKGKSGRRFQSKKTIDRLLSFADTVVLRAIRNEQHDEMERARLAVQLTLKKIAERTENVNVQLTLSDELMRRIMQRLSMSDEAAALEPPPEVYVLPEPPDPSQPTSPDTHAL